jgi:hypothetical protein
MSLASVPGRDDTAEIRPRKGQTVGGCDPGHDWRLERESKSYVKYRCSVCGSVCVAPKPVPEQEPLVVSGMAEDQPADDGPLSPVTGSPGADADRP